MVCFFFLILDITFIFIGFQDENEQMTKINCHFSDINNECSSCTEGNTLNNVFRVTDEDRKEKHYVWLLVCVTFTLCMMHKGIAHCRNLLSYGDCAYWVNAQPLIGVSLDQNVL